MSAAPTDDRPCWPENPFSGQSNAESLPPFEQGDGNPPKTGSRKDSRTSGGALQYLVLDDAGLLAQCHVDTYRASGPGGQKRNKTDSAVRLRHAPTGLIAIGTESRSQHENKARALRRLRKTLALSIRVPVDAENYQPSPVLRSCISGSDRLAVGQKDHRYLQAVSEVLDVLAGCEMQVSTAAALIGISTANLVGFLQKDVTLWDCANRMRATAGLKPLR